MTDQMDLRTQASDVLAHPGDTQAVSIAAADGEPAITVAPVVWWGDPGADFDAQGTSTAVTTTAHPTLDDTWVLPVTGPAAGARVFGRIVVGGAVAASLVLRGSSTTRRGSLSVSSVLLGRNDTTILLSALGSWSGGGGGAGLSDANPAALGATAAPGTGVLASRDDHVHPRPTPGDIGAATAAQGATADSAVQPGDLPATIVESVVAGSNVTVDDTDPANPIVSASGGGGFSRLFLLGGM